MGKGNGLWLVSSAPFVGLHRWHGLPVSYTWNGRFVYIVSQDIDRAATTRNQWLSEGPPLLYFFWSPVPAPAPMLLLTLEFPRFRRAVASKQQWLPIRVPTLRFLPFPRHLFYYYVSITIVFKVFISLSTVI